MDERFVPLATYVRASAVPAPGVVAIPAIADIATDLAPSAVAPTVSTAIVDFAHADIVHDLVTLQIAAREAFERTARRAIDALAHEVLARELTIAPADIDPLVARALVAFAEHEPLEIVVSIADRERVRAPLPIRSDPALVAGDLIVVVRDGSFESRFGFRFDDALERHRESPR